MIHYKKIHTIQLLLITLSLGLLTSTSHQQLLSTRSSLKIGRSLQSTGGSFGGYTINRGELPEECDDYTIEEIQISEQEFKDGMKGIEYFTFMRPAIDAYVEEEDDSKFQEQAGPVAFRVAASVIFFLLSLIMFFVFLIYFFCNCLSKICCSCCNDDDESYVDKDGDSADTKAKKEKKRAKRSKKIKKMSSDSNKKMIVGCSLCLTVIISVLGIIWGIFMFNAIGGVKRTSCSVGHTFENIREGVKTDDINFGGLRGMKFLLTEIKDAVNDINQADIDGILNEDFETLGNDAFNSLGTFHAARNGDRTTSCADGTANSITPDHISQLTTEFNSAVAEEFKGMRDNGKSLNDAA
jgi:hypothetical protein